MKFLKNSVNYMHASLLAWVLFLTGHAGAAAPAGYVKIWEDTFETPTLNTANWTVGLKDPATGDLVPGALQAQYLLGDGYAGYITEEDVVTGTGAGSLILKNQKRSYRGTDPRGNFEYTSGWVMSMHKVYFNKGYVEFRAKFPTGDKVWPAFWLVAEDLQWGPEWDMWEYFGYRSDAGYDAMGMHLCYDTYPNQQWFTNWIKDFNTASFDATQWHTYGFEWTSTFAKWSIDGVVVKTLNNTIGNLWPNENMYFILNNGVKTDVTDANTVWPNQVEIDYVSLYQLAPTVTFTAASQSKSEGGGTATITAQLSAASANAITVPFTLSGTAATPADYTITASPITIPAGSTTASITVTIVDDATYENPNETVIVTMGTPTNATKGATTVHTLTISENDPSTSPGTLALSAASSSAAENAGPATITVTRSGGSVGAASVQYATSNGTATAGSDYTATSGTLNWADGDAANKTFTIPITNDATVESNETVNITLSTASGATLGAPATAVLTIADEDGQPIVLVGGDTRNGNFNNPTISANFPELANWYNLGSVGQAVKATGVEDPYDATAYAELGYTAGAKIFAIDTGHTLASGDVFSLKYVWKDGWLWVDNTHQVSVSLFVTSDNTVTGTQTLLVNNLSGLSTSNNTYESVVRNSVYTANATHVGKRLFAKIETTNTGEAYAGLDNFELTCMPGTPPLSTYPVTYNGNGHTSGTVPSSQTKTHDVNLTLDTNSGNLARDGYVFAGWNTLADGSGSDFAAGASYTDNSSLTLYVKWIEDLGAPTVVSFNPTDNATGFGISENLVITYNEPIALDTGAITIRKSSDGSVVETYDVSSQPGNLSVSGNTLTINPTSNLAYGTGYYVTTSATAIRDLTGNHAAEISTNSTWNFTTQAANSVVLFADNFNRTSSADLNALTTGKSGSLGALNWTKKTINGASNPVPTIDIISSIALRINNGTGDDDGAVGGLAWVDHNFTNLSQFTVSVDITASTSAGDGRNAGFSIGQSLAELNARTNAGTSPADLHVGWDNFGTSTGVVIYKQGSSLGYFGSGLSAPDTLSATFTFADMNAGTTVNYEVFLNGSSIATGTTTWSGTNENYINLQTNTTSDTRFDNFQVSGVALPPNSAPLWAFHSFNKANATEGAAYSSNLTGSASDADHQPLSFAKVSGPTWLNVAADGTLSGTPASADVGANRFMVSVSDGIAAPVEATLNIAVLSAFESWVSAGGGGSITFDGDSNNDGVVDGLAWLLGSAQPAASANALVPAGGQIDQGKLIIGFDYLKASKRGTAKLILQHSNSLAANSWTSVQVPETSGTVDGVAFTISPIDGSDLNDVQATVPAIAAEDSGKIFVRLRGDSTGP